MTVGYQRIISGAAKTTPYRVTRLMMMMNIIVLIIRFIQMIFFHYSYFSLFDKRKKSNENIFYSEFKM